MKSYVLGSALLLLSACGELSVSNSAPTDMAMECAAWMGSDNYNYDAARYFSTDKQCRGQSVKCIYVPKYGDEAKVEETISKVIGTRDECLRLDFATCNVIKNPNNGNYIRTQNTSCSKPF